MIDLPILGVISVLLLALYLYFRVVGGPHRRRRNEPAGTPIDTAPIASKVAAVRNNPFSALEAKAVRKSRRSMLIAAARGMIRQLSFFRSREHEHGT